MVTLYEIAEVLVNKTKERKIITYGELSNELDKRIIARGLPVRLTQINDYAEVHNVPLLSAIVVNSRNREPGDGFFEKYAPHMQPNQWHRFWQEKLEEIWNYEEWDKFLNQIRGLR